MTPKATMHRYFETWNAHDFDAFQALLADDMTFTGPLATVTGAAECRRGIEGMSQILDRVQVLATAAEGGDVITWFEMYLPDADPVPGANWSCVEDGQVRRVRVAFDPRTILG